MGKGSTQRGTIEGGWHHRCKGLVQFRALPHVKSSLWCSLQKNLAAFSTFTSYGANGNNLILFIFFTPLCVTASFETTQDALLKKYLIGLLYSIFVPHRVLIVIMLYFSSFLMFPDSFAHIYDLSRWLWSPWDIDPWLTLISFQY